MSDFALRRPPRPVRPELSERIAAAADELAREWLVELLSGLPLTEVAEVPIRAYAADAPGLAAAAARALGDNAALDALVPRASTVRALASHTASPAAVSATVDALQSALWRRALTLLEPGDTHGVGELAERLQHVSALVRAGALAGHAPFAPPAPDPPPRPEPDPHPQGTRDPDRPPDSPSHPPADQESAPTAAFAARLRDVTAGRAATGATPHPIYSEAEPAHWLDALSQEMRLARLSAQRLALLLIELEDAERLTRGSAAGPAAEPVAGDDGSTEATGTRDAGVALEDAEELARRFGMAIRGALRRGDLLVMESGTRAWVIARETGRVSARALAERIAGALRDGEPWRGAPLRASAGVALLGEDGSDPESLIDAAEVSRLAASARGLVLVEEVDGSW